MDLLGGVMDSCAGAVAAAVFGAVACAGRIYAAGTAPEAVTALGETTTVLASCNPCITLLIALRKASADWKRSSADLAIEVRIISFRPIGRPGFKSTGGVGVCWMWAAMMEKLLSP